MTRVWLEEWEWACCGDPITVGGDVELTIGARTPPVGFAASLGPEIAGTVDAIESHHEVDPDVPLGIDRIGGRVTAIHAVLQEAREHRSLRRPGHGAPPDAAMPAEGEEWPLIGRAIGDGVFAGTRPSRWITERIPVPGAITLVPRQRVGEAPESPEDDDDAPAEQHMTQLIGWMVDVDEEA